MELDALAPITAEEYTHGLTRRNRIFRERVIQTMLLVVRPLPASVAEKLRVFADALGVDDDMISVARKYADGAEDLAAVDFSRNGYLGGLGAGRQLNSARVAAESEARPYVPWEPDPTRD
ncbi:hypothetical protein AB0L82_12315 [Nocardia sp. NPDC052001]|uniref:hypothetical protein n=1 Tax=Nocardia sp. NPDC052001 TaxID=3154853 RepID=UPI0034247C32